MTAKCRARHASRRFAQVLALTLLAQVAESREQAADTGKRTVAAANPGVNVQFELKAANGNAVVAEADALARFKLTDSQTHQPLAGVHPVAWMSLRKDATRHQPAVDADSCKAKIHSFLQEGLGFRPEIDLNSYFILVLNDQPSISVIDPLFGLGASKLVTQVPLKAPGQDWVMSEDQGTLYVTLPTVNEVAVIDIATWKVTASIAVGVNPARLDIQPDEKYLWVVSEQPEPDKGEITVIDRTRRQVVARFPAGSGHHELTFSSDSRYAFVGNEADASIAIFDVARLEKVKDLGVGPHPVSLAYSTLSQNLMVAHRDGLFTMIDGRKLDIAADKQAGSSFNQVRISPDGRWAFATNPKESTAYVFETASNLLVRTYDVGTGPDQINFTADYAYIRSSRTPDVSMIRLNGLGKPGLGEVAHFAAGQAAPNETSASSLADALVPAPDPGSVLVANPADKTIYYYSEGMAAPMGTFQTYGSQPRAVRVLDRSLREQTAGTYVANVRLPAAGTYDVAMLLDNPRYFECFTVTAEASHDQRISNTAAVTIEYRVDDRSMTTGKAKSIRFKLVDTVSGLPKENVNDIDIRTLLAPGTWSHRQTARNMGQGEYSAEITPPRQGSYYVYITSPSNSIRHDQVPFLVLHASD